MSSGSGSSSPASGDHTNYDSLVTIKPKENAAQTASLEGADEDPTFTKVVDRRWYERNKHIFPASSWEEFDPAKDYTTSIRRDADGNTFFFA
jgi:protein FAM50